MDELLFFITIIAALAIFGAAAIVFGVDSRDWSDDPRSPMRPTGIS